MSELERIWKSIDEVFDRDDELDFEQFLASLELEFKDLPGYVADAAGDLLKATFDAEYAPPDLKQSKYVIRERLNTGGQSEIYLADRSDGVYSKTVIIKIMSPRYGPDTFREHFFREMQLLADLSHPGIVPIIDGGLADDEKPWLVLEYIDGEHLDSYCKSEGLNHKEIVGLFLNLCEALGYIHLRGVVHMDLKASNVLVRLINGVAWPVIIDFGIALEAAARTSGESRPAFGTRGYSAPEQLHGQATDTRADIYSMGMMLAQVLSGGVAENIGLLPARERESLLRAEGVPGDLIQIIRKCTQRNVDQRYNNAGAFRQDLNNWLNDYPLAANRGRLLHVAGKTLRRHKLVSTGVAALLIAAMGFTYKYTSDIRHLQEVTRAEKNAGDTLLNFMLGDLFDGLTKIGRTDLLRITAQRSLDHLQNQDSLTFDASSWLQSAVAYINAGKVFDALESSTEALRAYSLAEENLQHIQNDTSHRRQYLRQSASLNVLRSLTLATEQQGSLTEEYLLKAVELATALHEEFADESPDLLWEAHLQLGWYYMEYDLPDQALEHIETANSIASGQLSGNSQRDRDARWVLNLSHSLQALAWHAFDYGELSDARISIDRAVELARESLAEDDEDIEFLDNYRILLNHQAFFLVQEGLTRSAKESVAEAGRVGRQLQLMAPKNLKYQRELGFSYTTGGELAEREGDDEAALANYQQSLAISRIIAEADQGGFSSANDLATDLVSVGNVMHRLGHESEALSHWEEAATVISPVYLREPDNKYYAFTLAVALIQLQRYEEAAPLIRQVMDTGMDDALFEALLVEHGID